MLRVFLLSLVVLASCGQKLIPGTRVPDTKENRVIADLVQKYRLAVERKDIDALKEMVSRRYYSNAGTTGDNQDDYGYDFLEGTILPMLRDDIKQVQFRIYLKRIYFQGDRAFAEFEYYYKFFYLDGGKERWFAKNDHGRLEFAKEDNVWRIVGGL